MPPDRFRGLARNDGRQRLGSGLLHVAQAAEVGEKALPRLWTDAGDIEQLRGAVADGSALAMIADSKAVALVANQLHKMEHRRAAVQYHRLLLVAVDVNDLLLFCNRRYRLRCEAKQFK